VLIEIPVPENTAFVKASQTSATSDISSPSYNSELNLIEWIGDIRAGQKLSFTLDVTVNANARTGDLIFCQGTGEAGFLEKPGFFKANC